MAINEEYMQKKTKITFSNDFFFNWVEEEIAAGRSVRFSVKGFSMMPLLRSEIDEVLLEPVICNIKVGEILLFRYLGKHILHRVIDIKSSPSEDGCKRYILRGDNVVGRREVASSCDVIGRVKCVYLKSDANGYREAKPISAGYKLQLLLWRMRILSKMAIRGLVERISPSLLKRLRELRNK